MKNEGWVGGLLESRRKSLRLSDNSGGSLSVAMDEHAELWTNTSIKTSVGSIRDVSMKKLLLHKHWCRRTPEFLLLRWLVIVPGRLSGRNHGQTDWFFPGLTSGLNNGQMDQLSPGLFSALNHDQTGRLCPGLLSGLNHLQTDWFCPGLFSGQSHGQTAPRFYRILVLTSLLALNLDKFQIPLFFNKLHHLTVPILNTTMYGTYTYIYIYIFRFTLFCHACTDQVFHFLVYIYIYSIHLRPSQRAINFTFTFLTYTFGSCT